MSGQLAHVMDGDYVDWSGDVSCVKDVHGAAVYYNIV